jgi:hypothetical protein
MSLGQPIQGADAMVEETGAKEMRVVIHLLEVGAARQPSI